MSGNGSSPPRRSSVASNDCKPALNAPPLAPFRLRRVRAAPVGPMVNRRQGASAAVLVAAAEPLLALP